MQRRSLYGACQAIGWSLYAVGVTLPYLARTPLGPLAGYSVALGLVGFAQTHALRGHARRAGWDRLSVVRLVPRVIASSALMGMVMNGFMVVASAYLFGERTWTAPVAPWRLLFMSWLWWFFPVFVGWQAMYFAVQFVRRAQRAELEKWQLEAAANAAELRFLKAQLNPHFLFNALNGLRGLISEDPARAQTMLTQLSTFLRSSLNASSPTVTLETELRVVNDYLAIESIRFEERLRVTMDVDPAALGMAIPAMLVQGLVENGIKHGIAHLPEGGEIAVVARATNGGVEILVSNTAERGNGAGRKRRGYRNRECAGPTATLGRRGRVDRAR